MMQQDLSARKRIMAEFVKMLEEPHPSVKGAALTPRIGVFLDAHFSRYCSFYDRKKLLRTVAAAPGYYMSFLSRPTDYERISVSRVTKAVGVNRTTFYKIFPNVTALYDACCDELADRFLSVPVPAEKTPEGMRDYVNTLWKIMDENETLMFTLSHRVNKRVLPYQIGRRLGERLRSSLTTAQLASFQVRENLAVAPELFSVWFSLIEIHKLAPELCPDRNLPDYDPKRSLIENIAACFSDRYGGGEEFYYTLGGAALKLLSEKRFYDVSISEFCRIAGYPRSTFYAHFTDFADYVMKVLENSVMVCLSAFLYYLDNPAALTPESLAVFRGEMVDFKIDGVRAIFQNGSIAYVFSVLFAYLMRIFIAEKEKADGPCSEAFHALLSYYLAYAIRLFSMNYMGDMSDAELFAKRGELERIKKLLREK